MLTYGGPPGEDLTKQTFLTHISSSMSFNARVKAGKYDLVDRKKVTRVHFPFKEEKIDRELTITFLQFEGSKRAEEVLRIFRSRGLRPVTIVELLALGAEHPELQRQGTFIALGSLWLKGRRPQHGVSPGDLFAPCLTGNENVRFLSAIIVCEGLDAKNYYAVTEI